MLLVLYYVFDCFAGELAICDSATNKIHLLSPYMDRIKTICVPYVSPTDLPPPNAESRISFSSRFKGLAGTTPTAASRVQLKKGIVSEEKEIKGEEVGLGGPILGTEAAARAGIVPSGTDYLEYLSKSIASKITFTDR